MMSCQVDDLLIVGRRCNVIAVFKESKKKVDVTYTEVTGSTTYLGRRLEVRRDEVIFGVDPKYVQNILTEMGLTDLKGERVEVGKDYGRGRRGDGRDGPGRVQKHGWATYVD